MCVSVIRPCVSQKILLFRKSRKSSIFDSQKSSENKLSLFRFQLLQNLPKILPKHQNILVYVECRRYIFNIFDIFRLISVRFLVSSDKFCENDSKKGRKSQKLYRNFNCLTFDRQLLTFNRLSKCTKIFDFRLLTFPV